MRPSFILALACFFTIIVGQPPGPIFVDDSEDLSKYDSEDTLPNPEKSQKRGVTKHNKLKAAKANVVETVRNVGKTIKRKVRGAWRAMKGKKPRLQNNEIEEEPPIPPIRKESMEVKGNKTEEKPLPSPRQKVKPPVPTPRKPSTPLKPNTLPKPKGSNKPPLPPKPDFLKSETLLRKNHEEAPPIPLAREKSSQKPPIPSPRMKRNNVGNNVLAPTEG